MLDEVLGAFNLNRFLPWFFIGFLTLVGFLVLWWLVNWVEGNFFVKKEEG